MKHLLKSGTGKSSLWQKIGSALQKPRQTVEAAGEEIRGLDDLFPETTAELILEIPQQSGTLQAVPAPERLVTEPIASSDPVSGRHAEPIPQFEASLRQKVRWPDSTEPVTALPVSGTLVMAACQREQRAVPEAEAVHRPGTEPQAASREEAGESVRAASTATKTETASNSGDLSVFDHLGHSNRIINNSINSLVARYFEKSGRDGDGAAQDIPQRPASC